MNDRILYKQKTFRDSILEGVDLAGKQILKTSASSTKAVKNGPVGLLAVNVDETLNVFVKESDGSKFVRFLPLANRIVDLIMKFRTNEKEYGNFWKTVDITKIKNLGIAFGFMTGTAVMTSMTRIFLGQAHENLVKNTEITDEAKKLCMSYVNDAITLVMMGLTSKLDKEYKVSKSERRFFSAVLTNSEWTEQAQKDAVEALKQNGIEEAPVQEAEVKISE